MSVQHAAARALQLALQNIEEDGFVLFIEDDVIFSSQFSRALGELQIRPDTGFVTLFQPRSRYPSLEVSPHCFYGTQCLLFPYRPVRDIVENWTMISAVLRLRWGVRSGYDILWSNYLATRGYKLYRTDFSYVQHIGIISRLGHSPGVAEDFVV